MASHPYISGPKNVAQVIALLRKNFPSTVNSDTIKKYGLASNNESYVINVLKFIGLVDEDGKRTADAHDVFSLHDDEAFKAAFSKLVRSAYSDLFDLRGEEAWTLDQAGLVSYFRSADKTSEIIGGRQAGVFKVLASLAGHGDPIQPASKPARAASKAPPKGTNAPKVPRAESAVERATETNDNKAQTKARETALMVRIEINLPAGGTKQNYDDIFRSMKEHLLND